MISCPKCEHDLKIIDLSYECEYCKETFECDSNGIIYFHPEDIFEFEEHTEEGLDAIMQVEKHHFWFLTRCEFLEEKLKSNIKYTDLFAEVGAGSGNITEKIKDICNELTVIDIQRPGLVAARDKGINDLYQMNINRNVFKDHFDAVGVFDVLEHLRDDDLALQNIYTMLKSKGKLFISVPAFPFLWNKRDVIENHQRRYSMDELKNILTTNGFRIIESRYFFFSIFPLLTLRTIIWNLSEKKVSKNDYIDNVKINPIINRMLLYVTRVENFIFRYIKPPFGGSLFILVEKNT